MSDTYRDELIQVAASAIAAVTCFDQGTTSLFQGDVDVEADNETFDHWFLGIVDEVYQERHRQEMLWGPQKHDPFVWLAILGEEVGEADAAALLDRFPAEEAAAKDRRRR
jgi:hypothetical protein